MTVAAPLDRRALLVGIVRERERRQPPADLHPKQLVAFNTDATEVLYGGAAGGGKALALDTPVPTPAGWTTMGDIRVGDTVFDERGVPCRVVAATEVMHGRPCYAVRFSDGAAIVADAEHQWLTSTVAERQAFARSTEDFRARRRASRTLRGTGKRPDLVLANAQRSYDCAAPMTSAVRTTEQIAATIAARNRTNHAVAVAGSLQLPDVNLPVDPYVLGAWLGDGTSSQGAGFTSADIDIIETIRAAGYVVRKRASKYGWGILGLHARLRSLGLINNKHVPQTYLRASATQRLELLRGLMDTDGSCNIAGACEFTTTDRPLADGTVELLRTLGIKATVTEGVATIGGRAIGPKYRIKFSTAQRVFHLRRKADRQITEERGVQSLRMIVAATPIASVPVRCIQVDSPSHLFLAGREMIPTHNSHLMRRAAIRWCQWIPDLQVYLFRREFSDLYKNHMEGPSGFPALLGEMMQRGEARIVWSKNQIRFANGSVIHLCHCQHDKDVYGYQGAEIHVLMIDELTQWARGMYTFLRSRVRLGALKIPTWLKGLFPRCLLGANPGGIGHNWVKADFIDIAPALEIVAMPSAEGGMNRQFIPARLEDNPTMTANDPDYESKLEGIGSPELARAMRLGDWDIVAGGFFDDLWMRDVHVVKPFPLPTSWRLNRSFDWGSSKPFSVGWWAESDGSDVKLPNGTTLRTVRGDLFHIAEWYGWNGTPNEGSKMLAVDIAKGIAQRERQWRQSLGWVVHPGPADTAIWTNENGMCIADDMKKAGVTWTEADKSPGSRANGWERIRMLLKQAYAPASGPRESPGLFVFDNCTHFIRTVPVLPRDPHKTDDIDTKAEDHAADMARYRITEKRVDRRMSVGTFSIGW